MNKSRKQQQSRDEFLAQAGYPNLASWWGSIRDGRQYIVHPGEEVHTKRQYPYSYSPFYLYGDQDSKADDGAYTDRMVQWDHKKWQEACAAHLSKVRFDTASPEQLQAFIRQYFDKPELVLTQVIEYCNAATGYPVWYLGWRKK